MLTSTVNCPINIKFNEQETLQQIVFIEKRGVRNPFNTQYYYYFYLWINYPLITLSRLLNRHPLKLRSKRLPEYFTNTRQILIIF